MAPCPVCYEEATGQEMAYAAMSNHSWQNSTRCDGHGICSRCVGRHVELQILDEGHFNPRCPGIGCRYRLVPLDVERALQHAQRGDEAWRRFEQLRSQCHEGRLRALVQGLGAGPEGLSDLCLLESCQPCPQCLTLVRREVGCPHVFCRCGCSFCHNCGGPGPEGCLCAELDRNGELVFAAWHRSAPESPFEWLWDGRAEKDEERVLQTLHFWLWMAQLPVGAPWSEREEAPHGLQPIAWRQPGWRYQHDMDGDTDCEFTDCEDEDHLANHYPRVPAKAVCRYASERQQRQERSERRPLRWAQVRAGDQTDVVPLRVQRQPKAVAQAARAAQRRTRA